MKKRNLNSKQLRLMSVGLLASSAVLSVADSAPIVAKEKESQDNQRESEQESVTILSSTTEETDSSKETIGSDTSSTSTSSKESTSMEETVDSSSTDSTNTNATTTSDSSNSSSSSSNSSTSSSSSSSNSSTSSTSTSQSKPQPKPKPKPKPKPTQPSRPVWVGSGNNVQGPAQPSTPNYPVSGTVIQGVGNGSSETISVSPNLTTKAFINVIGEDAREVAGTNNLYASVMIAQAILESASGNSTLASAPNYNLFGIKGNYKGASANFLTSEDNGSGSMYTIRSDFRKYPSYKESLEDYVKLLRGGTDFNNSFYNGTWKSNTKTYKDATNFLTGKYATDTSYSGKLNGLIDAYNLTQYDELKDKPNDKKAAETKSTLGLDKKISKKDKKEEDNIEFVTHIVKKGESLKSISELYNISTLAILEKNQLDRRMLFIGQSLKIPKQEIKINELRKEVVVDRSFEMAQKLSSAVSGRGSKSAASISRSSKTKTSSLVSEDSNVISSNHTSSSVENTINSSSRATSLSSENSIVSSSRATSSSSEDSTMDSSRATSSSSEDSTMDSSRVASSSSEDSTTDSSKKSNRVSSASKSKTKKAKEKTVSSEKETTTSSDYKISASRTKTKYTYEVKEGDTLASISKKTGVSIWSLKEWNELDQYFLTEGQLLVLNPAYKLDA